MAPHTWLVAILLTSLVLLPLVPISHSSKINENQSPIPKSGSEADLVQFTKNPGHLVAEFFCYAATGQSSDAYAPGLANGGPPSIGSRLAKLDPHTKDVFNQFCLITTGHLRALNYVVKPLPRPLINMSKEVFGEIVNAAFGQPLPPFDPYANTLNCNIGAYIVSYAASSMFAGIAPKLQNPEYKKLVAGLLGVASQVRAVIRSYLYVRKDMMVTPYKATVAEFTDRLAVLSNKLGKEGEKAEGLVVPPSQGAEGKVSGNLLEADKFSLSFTRSPEGILRIAYGTGNESMPGSFFPKGANGRIAQRYLNSAP